MLVPMASMNSNLHMELLMQFLKPRQNILKRTSKLKITVNTIFLKQRIKFNQFSKNRLLFEDYFDFLVECQRSPIHHFFVRVSDRGGYERVEEHKKQHGDVEPGRAQNSQKHFWRQALLFVFVDFDQFEALVCLLEYLNGFLIERFIFASFVF